MKLNSVTKDIWLVGTLNQLLISACYIDIKFLKK